MPAKPKLCVFDLDGTLVDSLRDIAEALNECLALLGVPQHPLDGYRYMVGEGVPKLCERAIGDAHPELVPRLIDLARARYRTRPLQATRPYAGVPELVEALSRRGVILGVLSNKPHDLTVRMVDHFWPNNPFRFVQGYVAEASRKPDPRHLLEMCSAAGIVPRDCCMIGDTPTDVATAQAAGAGHVAVTWGFRTHEDLRAGGAERMVDRPEEVLAALAG